jgi:hypothetical protein
MVKSEDLCDAALTHYKNGKKTPENAVISKQGVSC